MVRKGPTTGKKKEKKVSFCRTVRGVVHPIPRWAVFERRECQVLLKFPDTTFRSSKLTARCENASCQPQVVLQEAPPTGENGEGEPCPCFQDVVLVSNMLPLQEVWLWGV